MRIYRVVCVARGKLHSYEIEGDGISYGKAKKVEGNQVVSFIEPTLQIFKGEEIVAEFNIKYIVGWKVAHYL